MKITSQLLEDAVDALATLPGIGKKTALRLALFLHAQQKDHVLQFTDAIKDMRLKLKSCQRCGNISDLDMCAICKSPKRNKDVICVVESVRDILAIEETNQYNGVYHVLGGVISPIDGITPAELTIDELIERVRAEKAKELIMAISPTIEGETTIYYISSLLEGDDINISTISRGVSYGGGLEYADEITLGRSIRGRVPYRQGPSE